MERSQDPIPIETRSALLLDLYQLTMAQSYHAEGMAGRPATFSLFARSLPEGWGYFVAAGLEDVLDYLESFAFGADDLGHLAGTGLFTDDFLAYLGGLRFTGAVRAMPEGTLFFADEPVLEVTAPVVEAQLVETVVLNEIHYQSLVAAKAARCVDVARGRTLAEFGLRRTHRAAAAMRAARSSYLAGFDSTSNVLAGKAYGIPIAGTMAHSYVTAFEDELEAFRAYARSYPDRAILLVDTYSTPEGVRRAAVVGRELRAAGDRLAGIRLDSGDLETLARQARELLDAEGLADVAIVASGGLDEHAIAALLAAGAPIDGFGVGSALGTVADAPFLDMAYKLTEFDGRPVLKLSATKSTWPGRKQVWRLRSGDRFAGDVIGLEGEPGPSTAEPLLVPAMVAGARVAASSLTEARARCASQRELLAARHRSLAAEPYPVEHSERLTELREATAAQARRRHGLADA